MINDAADSSSVQRASRDSSAQETPPESLEILDLVFRPEIPVYNLQAGPGADATVRGRLQCFWRVGTHVQGPELSGEP